MPHVPRRPPALAHLSDEAASIVLARHFGDMVKAARELGVKCTDLRRLTWHNPRILNAAHERIELFRIGVRSKIIGAVYSRSAKRRRWGFDAMFDSYEFRDHPFVNGLSLFAPAWRARGPHRLVEGGGKVALEREAAAEQAIERQREAAAERELELERERVEVMVERRPSAPTASLWPSHIRRPTRGRRW
jgi:hypothetical protein